MAYMGAGPEQYGSMLQRSREHRVELPCGCVPRGEDTVLMMNGGQWTRTSSVQPLAFAIVHLFNYHVMTVRDWTLQRLIDWVGSVEPPDPYEIAEPVAEPAEAVCA
jgi:hypothetical protein